MPSHYACDESLLSVTELRWGLTNKHAAQTLFLQTAKGENKKYEFESAVETATRTDSFGRYVFFWILDLGGAGAPTTSGNVNLASDDAPCAETNTRLSSRPSINESAHHSSWRDPRCLLQRL